MKKEAKQLHKNFKKFGLESLKVLEKEVDNPRYPGFSKFFSSNVLQNSSYIWRFPGDVRFKANAHKKLCDNIYSLPMYKSTRAAGIGYGFRKNPFPVAGKGTPSPGAYNLKNMFDANIEKMKGATIHSRYKSSGSLNKRLPGVGTYNIGRDYSKLQYGTIPVGLKFRHGFFYDDDLKQKEGTVSMERYRPKHTLTEPSRFGAITFGIGTRPNLYLHTGYPGPGAYNVPGIFDRGYKGKLPLN